MRTTTNPLIHWTPCKPSRQVRHRGGDRRVCWGSNPGDRGKETLPLPLGHKPRCNLFLFYDLMFRLCIYIYNYSAETLLFDKKKYFYKGFFIIVVTVQPNLLDIIRFEFYHPHRFVIGDHTWFQNMSDKLATNTTNKTSYQLFTRRCEIL
jgi:hypothetical protein